LNKTDLIESIAKKGKISKAEAKRTVDLVFGQLEAGLRASKKTGRYHIASLGTFVISKRSAWTGRNPRTGQAVKVKAANYLRFKPSANLKKAAGCRYTKD